MAYRTKTCKQIGEDTVGEEVVLAGWIENIRDHGGVSFLDLRDFYGVVQVVMRDTSLLKGLSREDCISVCGIIEHREPQNSRGHRRAQLYESRSSGQSQRKSAVRSHYFQGNARGRKT